MCIRDSYKKSLVSSISNKTIDDYYSRALDVGAVGGKLLGAGGGGCLLFYVEPQNQENIRRLLYRLREVKFDFENEGTKIIYVSDWENGSGEYIVGYFVRGGYS